MYIVLIRLYGYFPLDLFLWCNIVAQAGLAYLQHRNLLVHCHCDKVHRLIRDLKLSNGCDPKFNEAVLAATYAWSVNYKPHGSGAFGDEKYDLLANFFDTCVMEDSLKANLIILVLWFFLNTIQKSSNVKLVADDVVQKLLEQDSEHFQRYKCLMALDFEDDFGRTPTDEELWNQMSELPSFLAKKGLPKPGRWFAWHECAHQQLKEFFATRCLLHWYFEDEGLPAPEEVHTKFQKCKGDLGAWNCYIELWHMSTMRLHVSCSWSADLAGPGIRNKSLKSKPPSKELSNSWRGLCLGTKMITCWPLWKLCMIGGLWRSWCTTKCTKAELMMMT